MTKGSLFLLKIRNFRSSSCPFVHFVDKRNGVFQQPAKFSLPTPMIESQPVFLLHRMTISTVIVLFLSASASSQTPPRPSAQNPSPMVGYTRKHERIPQEEVAGLKFVLESLLPKPVQVFIPDKSRAKRDFDLLIHFHGAEHIVQYAASRHDGNLIAATVNLGSGSRVYNDAFLDTLMFAALRDSIVARAGVSLGAGMRLHQVILSGFSAGYGAIRRIISTRNNYDLIDGVLLLDGLHTSYIPEGKPLAEGGQIDPTGLLPFLQLAEDALMPDSRKKFLITHSEIFPGTFVSTTEATDYLLRQMGLSRVPVLVWGPLGMQQLSAAGQNRFAVRGFAGNTAPDHVDHLHALDLFLGDLLKL
jgi:hypothetical protein